MRRFELNYRSINHSFWAKPVTALVIAPDTINADTGIMLFSHGWGGNRFQHEDKMAWTADRHNLITVSVEFRQSGYQFDPVKGNGADQPYDASFYQVIDTLLALRQTLTLYPQADHRRLYHYGGSQGGHIALLSSVYAPDTFAWVYASCPLTHLDDKFQRSAGRLFAPQELAARHAIDLSRQGLCPVYVEYGDADETVDCTTHAEALIARLTSQGRLARSAVYAGGRHDLTPAITKMAAYEQMAPHLPWDARLELDDDLTAGRVITIPCAGHALGVNWRPDTPLSEILLWRS